VTHEWKLEQNDPLSAKARFGQAAETRPRLLALVLERLTEAGIALVD
jgi:hypothetical protein